MDGSSIGKKPTEVFLLYCNDPALGAYAPPVVRCPTLLEGLVVGKKSKHIRI